ncbi:hypothetical protein G7Z17_g8833 [Cylindrodendrum hubeiense]|uniref:Uncharacterized protein n=1 Tax=Cylindrodendrum hubeiense TaxID=595255 RepID=A0A9P5LDY1_9HYPO|nr:hypothetical protein G7Z17_g8833 [Cylindrodendrum hubeiense]
MSLTRAFTNRKARMGNDLGDSTKSPQRSNSTRNHNPQMMRGKISGPIQLVHTTNMLSYNAPDLPQPSLRTKASIRSTDSLDSLSETHSAESSPPTSPEVSPVQECPGPTPNHLSTYFMVPERGHMLSQADAPAIPRRSPSHTKQNSYDTIARHRSTSRMSKDSEHSVSTKASFTFSRTSSTSTRASSGSSLSNGHGQKLVAPPVPPPAARPTLQQRVRKDSHPFGHELAQVTELAEEYGGRSNTKNDDEDSMYIKTNGLVKFTADDYISDVQNLITSFFPEMGHAKPSAPMWI